MYVCSCIFKRGIFGCFFGGVQWTRAGVIMTVATNLYMALFAIVSMAKFWLFFFCVAVEGRFYVAVNCV